MISYRKHLLSFVASLAAAAFLVGCTSHPTVDYGQLAKDQLDCQNLISMHAWYHSSFQNDTELNTIWAQKADDVVFAQNSGYWKGLSKIKAYYGVPIKNKSQVVGHFQMHTITTAVIVVAGDRKTAKGIFYTPGMVGSYKDGAWMWERYGVDFLNEDGTWKIWHLHVYSDFANPIGKEMGAPPLLPGGAPPKDSKPPAGGPTHAERFGTESLNAPTAASAPLQPGAVQVAPGVWLSAEAMTPSYSAKPGYKELGPDTIPLPVPRPPAPYATFGDTFSYADPNEYATALASMQQQ